LKIPANGVSGQHLEISKEGDRFFLRDLGSRNGTFLEDEKISYKPISLPATVRLGINVKIDLSASDLWSEAEGAVKAMEEAASVIASSVSIGLGSSSNRKKEVNDFLSPNHGFTKIFGAIGFSFSAIFPILDLVFFSRTLWERLLIFVTVFSISLTLSSLVFFRRRALKQETEVVFLTTALWSFSYWTILLSSVLFHLPMAFDWKPGILHLVILSVPSVGVAGLCMGYLMGSKRKVPLGLAAGVTFSVLYVFVLWFPLQRIEIAKEKREKFFQETPLDFWSGRTISSAEFGQKIRELEKQDSASR